MASVFIASGTHPNAHPFLWTAAKQMTSVFIASGTYLNAPSSCWTAAKQMTSDLIASGTSINVFPYFWTNAKHIASTVRSFCKSLTSSLKLKSNDNSAKIYLYLGKISPKNLIGSNWGSPSFSPFISWLIWWSNSMACSESTLSFLPAAWDLLASISCWDSIFSFLIPCWSLIYSFLCSGV